jgi:hypothetical protein
MSRVVAASGLAFGARIAHEKLGLPLATVHLQPVVFRSVRRPAVFGFPDVLGFLPRPLRGPYLRAADRFVIDPPLAPAVNAFRAGLGLPPVSRLLHRWMHSPQLVIGLFPEWFAAPQPDWPPNVHLTGFPLYDERDSREPQPELHRLRDSPPACLNWWSRWRTISRTTPSVSADWASETCCCPSSTRSRPCFDGWRPCWIRRRSARTAAGGREIFPRTALWSGPVI